MAKECINTVIFFFGLHLKIAKINNMKIKESDA